MKLLDTPAHRQPQNFERPSWLVTCALKRREPFGTVSTQTKYELAASNEEEARATVRNFVQQAHPRCVIESIRVARQNLAQPA